MTISVFDLFKVGIGPSSSHTVGPMKAARAFVVELATRRLISRVTSVRVELFGSLGATGAGHGTDRAVVAGLRGARPETVDPEELDRLIDGTRGAGRLLLHGGGEIGFDDRRDLVLHRKASLPRHPNGMRFTALAGTGAEVCSRTYYSVGGGFVTDEAGVSIDRGPAADREVPLPFHSAEELLARCRESRAPVSAVVRANELTWHSEAEVRERLLTIWMVMQASVTRGCERDGTLPGVLRVPRRAPDLFRKLSEQASADPLGALEWVDLFAIAVNEENAGGGRVVTAPTNGAAGIVPAVLHYYARFTPEANDEGVVRFLLTAGAIGALCKENASISGADVGCQGEVGSACAMAAAGLCEVLGGTPSQVENAAEIGLEHNLGLTCDPVAGLVQIPCIERNAVGAVKAINAARIAMLGDGSHLVSLDDAIRTMRATGADMKRKYKETSRGGLAVHVARC